VSIEQALQDRVVSHPLTRAMCAPIGDGAAAALLCCEEFLRRQPAEVQERAVRVRASALSGGKYRDLDEAGLSRIAADKAYRIAGLGPEGIDLVEVYDATWFYEIYQLEMLGFGAIVRRVADTRSETRGRIEKRIFFSPGKGADCSYIIQGEMILEAEGETHHLNPGDALILRQGGAHKAKVIGTDDPILIASHCEFCSLFQEWNHKQAKPQKTTGTERAPMSRAPAVTGAARQARSAASVMSVPPVPRDGRRPASRPRAPTATGAAPRSAARRAGSADGSCSPRAARADSAARP